MFSPFWEAITTVHLHHIIKIEITELIFLSKPLSNASVVQEEEKLTEQNQCNNNLVRLWFIKWLRCWPWLHFTHWTKIGAPKAKTTALNWKLLKTYTLCTTFVRENNKRVCNIIWSACQTLLFHWLLTDWEREMKL